MSDPQGFDVDGGDTFDELPESDYAVHEERPADTERGPPWTMRGSITVSAHAGQRGLTPDLLIVDERSGLGVYYYGRPGGGPLYLPTNLPIHDHALNYVNPVARHQHSRQQRSRLVQACCDGNAVLVERYLQEGDDLDRGAICAATRNGHTGVVRVLLEHGLTPLDVDAALFTAVEKGNLGLVTLFIESARGTQDYSYMLYSACEHNRVDIVDYFMTAFTYTKEEKERAMFAAAESGKTAVMELLASKGVSLHARGALSSASFEGFTDVVKLILSDNKAAQSELDSAATHALLQFNFNTLDLLSAAGASFDIGELKCEEIYVTQLIELERWADLERLVLAGVYLEFDQWLFVPLALRPRLAVAHTKARFDDLPASLKPLWALFHRPIKRRLLAMLRRARYRLDRPPTEPLGTDAPTREQLIAHLRTAGRKFARDYWAEGREIFFPGLELGGVPEEFMPVRLGAKKG